MQKIIKHTKLGDIVVNQTSRARRISISLRPPATVKLTLPLGVALSDAMAFLEQKSEWVEAGIAKIKKKHPDLTIEMPYSTRSHSLRYNPCGDERVSAQLTNTEFIVSYPMSIHFSDPRVQDMAKRVIDLAWRCEAEEALPPRVRELARLFNFKYRKLSVRNTRSKWGSCSSLDDISLSIHLMHLPDHLVDYVILHELCHTIHKNHGEHFYALLDRVSMGFNDKYRKELKMHSTRGCY